MKPKIKLVLVLFLGLASLGLSSRDTTLHYAATHFPPWDINIEETEVSGINADVIRTIADELKLTFEPVRCPWKRCLSLLEEGKIDMAGTVGRTPERERYLNFIEPPYAKVPDQVLYLPQKAAVEITTYYDLYQFKSIGIERGARVAPEFDNDTTLNKIEITKLEQLLMMLDRGRLDVIAGNEMVMDYMIKALGMSGKFKKASFRFESDDMEYLAISKKSPHIERLAEISQIISKLKSSGKIQMYIDSYTKYQN